MTSDSPSSAGIGGENADLTSILMDLHADLDPIDAEDFDVVSYINEVCYLA